MKIKRKVTTIVVEHPEYPEVKVTVKRLSRMEALDYYTGLEETNTVISPLKDRETGDYVRFESGEVQVDRRERFDISSIVELFKTTVLGWEGIEDESGPVSFSTDAIEILFNTDLDIKEGEDKGAFFMYLLNKVRDFSLGLENTALDPK